MSERNENNLSTADTDAGGAGFDPAQVKDALRPILATLARLMISDRRAVALVGTKGEVLLANQAANLIGLSQEALQQQLNWPELRERARRAGRVPMAWRAHAQDFEGEIIHLPMEPVDAYFLRLTEADQEAVWLRNRAQAAKLMRAAHDLRTPIQSLLASAQGMIGQGGQDHLPPLNKEALRHAAQISLDQINAMLATLRGEPEAPGVRSDEPIDIERELSDLIAMLQPVAASRSTRISTSYDLPPGLRLRGPVAHLRAIFQNLLANSINHGGGRVRAELACRPLGQDLDEGEVWGVTFTLRDEGGGLPEASRRRLETALRGEGVKPAEQGSRQSAGMEVLAHALRHLGGVIEVTDLGAEGRPVTPDTAERVIGTEFRVTFSLPRAVDEPERPSAPVPSADAALSGRRLLVVEDSPSARDWIIHVLQAAGAEVQSAASGPQALSLLSRPEVSKSIELILTDITLPLMSGIELAARIRAGDPTHSLVWSGPIIGLSAHADDRVRGAALTAGMDMVLEKPIAPADLVRHLSQVLQGQKALATNAPVSQGEVIDEGVNQTLAAQMGAEATQGFMRRALAEAHMVVSELAKEGIVPDTGRRLHAATGACGLTGLRLVEGKLRELEDIVENSPKRLVDHLPCVLDALHQTEALIGQKGLGR